MVDPARALTSAHHEQRGQIITQAEPLTRNTSIYPSEFVANRRAGDFGAHFRKERGAFLEAKQNSTHHSRGKPVRFSGNRVRFVNKSRNAAHAPGQDGSGRSEAAHAEDNLRFEFAIDGAAKREALAKSPDEPEDHGRKWRRQRNGGQFFEWKTRAVRQCERIDFFLGDQQNDFVATIAQHFRHGDAGEKMSAGSATCNHCVHES